jgi:hypothetical protein
MKPPQLPQLLHSSHSTQLLAISHYPLSTHTSAISHQRRPWRCATRRSRLRLRLRNLTHKTSPLPSPMRSRRSTGVPLQLVLGLRGSGPHSACGCEVFLVALLLADSPISHSFATGRSSEAQDPRTDNRDHTLIVAAAPLLLPYKAIRSHVGWLSFGFAMIPYSRIVSRLELGWGG